MPIIIENGKETRVNYDESEIKPKYKTNDLNSVFSRFLCPTLLFQRKEFRILSNTLLQQSKKCCEINFLDMNYKTFDCFYKSNHSGYKNKLQVL